MKEYYFQIKPEILNGLRVSKTNPRNTGKPVNCYNIFAGEQSLESLEIVLNPFESLYESQTLPPVEFPFPQMFFGKIFKLLCFKTQIFTVNVYTSPWTVQKVLDFGDKPSWIETTWHFADFHGTIIATNGFKMFWFNPDPLVEIWQELPIDSSRPLFKTLCNFNGRLIIGNIVSPWYNCDERFICWSKVGNFQLIPDETNTSGFMPMLFRDEILNIKMLGNNIVVYGFEGICVLSHSNNYFSIKQISNFGINSKDSVAGNRFKHIFIDIKGNFNILDQNLNIKKIGYQEFFDPLSLNHINISFDSLNDRFYICDGNKCYIYTEYGLTSNFQKVVSGINEGRFFVGNIINEDVEEETLNFKLTTDIFDLNNRNGKTLESIEIGSNYSDKCFISIDYRLNTNENFKTTKEVLTNKKGIVRLPCYGVEFRINFRFENYENVSFDHVIVKFKNTDKMNLRGLINVT